MVASQRPYMGHSCPRHPRYSRGSSTHCPSLLVIRKPRSLVRFQLPAPYIFATTRLRCDRVEPIHRRFIPHREPLAIRVHRKLDAGMPELSLHVCHGRALLQHQTGIGMSQTMWGEMNRKLRFLKHARHDFAQFAVVQRRPDFRTEHPSRHLGPPSPQGLGLSVRLESSEQASAKAFDISTVRPCPDFGVLFSPPDMAFAIRISLQHIDVGPFQADRLSKLHAGSRQRKEERIVAEIHLGGRVQK